MVSETFAPRGTLAADYAAGANWSGGVVPGKSTVAVVNNTVVSVDPQTSIAAHIVLQGDAEISGNGGAFTLRAGASVAAEGDNALYADGAIVNHGVISLGGTTASLQVVVEDGGGAILQSAHLKIPSLQNDSRIIISDGATLAVDGTEFSNRGHVIVDGGTLVVAGGGVDGGQGRVPRGGDIILSDGAYVSFSDAVANQNITFAGCGTLALADVTDVKQVNIFGFSVGSVILLDSVASAQRLLKKLSFAGLPENYAPTVVPTVNGAAIEYEATTPCFARGTGILTPSGYVSVEQLKPGDPVVTFSGAVRPVRWVGRRTIDIAAHNRPDAVRPVVVLAGAFGAGLPERDVRFSPDHALLLHGQLVPVKLLVNGVTIARDNTCQAVTYLHVELDRHEVLLAEGLAAESYIDTGNRKMFDRTMGAAHSAPVFGRGRQWDRAAYADLCLGGPVLRQIRQAVRARALAMGFVPRTMTEVSLWVGGQKYLPVGGSVERPIFRFAVPHSGQAMIRSARFVPAAFSSGEDDEDDYRCLGVAISQVRLGSAGFAPAAVAVSGFHKRAKGDVADWTDGNAVIAVPPAVDNVGLTIAALPRAWVRG